MESLTPSPGKKGIKAGKEERPSWVCREGLVERAVPERGEEAVEKRSE